jgi:predicted Zn-dependent peptidase
MTSLERVNFERWNVGGLRVVAIPQPKLERAHVALYVRVGSRFETAAQNGLSHFLEHMMYRGTKRLARAHDVNLAFEDLGGSLYASTQVDYGVFSVTAPKESLGEIIPLFGEVILGPRFADIDVERGIVIEEILEDLDDDGNDVNADNCSRRLIYPDHPLGFTITGTEARIRAFSKTELSAHHAKHYNSANAVLALAGAFDVKAMKPLVSEAFGGLAAGTAVQTTTPTHAQRAPRLEIVPNAASQMELRISFRAVAETDARRPIMDMLLRLLDDGMSTRLYHRISDSQGLCYDVSANFDGYEDDGILDFAASVNHERADRVTSEILSMMRELANEGPTEAELDRARRRNTWDTRSMRDSAEDTAGFLAGGILFERFETPEERLERNLAVTRQEIQTLCGYLIRPDRLNVVAVGDPDKSQRKRLEDLVSGFSP